jgi:CxxC motif-containing protein
MSKELTCIVCPNSCRLTVQLIDEKWNVTNARCPRGIPFAIQEMTNPQRTITSTVKTTSPKFPLLPVKTNGEVPQSLMISIMEIINTVEVNEPVHMGDVIISNVMKTGVDVVATCNMDQPYGGEHNEIHESSHLNI